MKFSAKGLPDGLKLDEQTGRITGQLSKPGEHAVTLRAHNALGKAERPLKIICGPPIALTPALGWNSWNCFAGAVSADKVKAAADAMVSSGLINHGWTYINIDDFWQVHRDSKDPSLQGPQRDAQGRILPNPRFPDMKGLAEYVHGKGLKIGLYSSPGPWTCGGCVGSYQHEQLDARQYADWGFDYLKYDWCSYDSIAPNRSLPELQKPYRVMRQALDQVPRDILFSFCQYGMGNVWEWGTELGGNSWRTTGDITDTWGSMSGIGFNQAGHEKFAGPGHFNDPDMLVVGKVGWGPALHPTRLTPNEQFTHISLWCLLSAPLLIGCDMTQLDDFTRGLLGNDEVLEVDQDPLGRQAARIAKDGPLEVWAKDMEDGSKAVGLFNRGPEEAKVSVNWSALGLHGAQMVRDLWQQADLGKFDGEFSAPVARHGVVLVRMKPQ
jgi:alpha-galactosidase